MSTFVNIPPGQGGRLEVRAFDGPQRRRLIRGRAHVGTWGGYQKGAPHFRLCRACARPVNRGRFPWTCQVPLPPTPLRTALESFKRPQEGYSCLSSENVRSRGVLDGLRPFWGLVRDPLRGRRRRTCRWSIFDCQNTRKAVRGLVWPSNCFCRFLLSAVFRST